MRDRDEHAGKRLCPGIEPGVLASKPDGVPEHWVHASRFRRERSTPRGVDVLKRRCKTCEQTIRVDNKNEDRATDIVDKFAARMASRAGTTKQFMLDEMNLRRLVPDVDTMLRHGCHYCGEAVTIDEVEFDHIEPLRNAPPGDLARYHVANVRPADKNCNRFKGGKTFVRFLEENEDARRAAHADRAGVLEVVDPPPLIAWRAPGTAVLPTSVPAALPDNRCPSIKVKTHKQRPGTTRRPVSTHRCALEVGHDGLHHAAESANQAPWSDDTLEGLN
jgi:hypothetical protein